MIEQERVGRRSQPDSPFADLGVRGPLLRAVIDAGYETPTPIQTKAIPPALDDRDVLGCAQTGTGKTAAFVLPTLQGLNLPLRRRGKPGRGRHAGPSGAGRRTPRALIMAPTRELAAQIGESIETYGRHLDVRHTVIFGGVSQYRQERALQAGVDVIVATPGRLLDLMNQRLVRLDRIEVLVIDEFDRMLDQGFWPSIRKIVAAIPKDRQNLLFSATMPKALRPLVAEVADDPVFVSVTPVASTPDKVDQTVHHVADQKDKRHLLVKVLDDDAVTRAVVFTRTKHGANRVARHLDEAGVRAQAIHGNKSQNARERALGAFKKGALRVLVATDVASRGIDIDDVSHVINFDLPMDAESYVHRIGRTARAGRTGKAVSFCSGEERDQLRRIEKLIGRRVPVDGPEPPPADPRAGAGRGPRPPSRRPGNRGGQGGFRARQGAGGGGGSARRRSRSGPRGGGGPGAGGPPRHQGPSSRRG
jgi:ATP-dependent RNA helicase RhlE